MTRRTSKAGADAGFVYVSALVILVAVAIAAQVALIPSGSARVRDMEDELLFRGEAYLKAIEAYARADPTAPSYPARLEDLLDDPREPGRRFIRQLWPDPVTGGDWQVIPGASGGIAGVASRSSARPRRQAFFPAGLEGLEGAARYADWQFVVKD